MAAALELRGLTKDYGKQRGIFDVSLEVQQGEVFGFLGPNGAGKTTAMRHLMGFVKPGAGEARIGGLACFSERAAIQRTLGYLPGEIACMDEMTGSAFLEFMARMKKLADRVRLHELADYFELDPSRKIRKMSKGTKQKVGLVCAFMGRPDLLLLDEPTSGLDPLMQGRFIDLVLAEKERGATVFLSSHLFEEVERTCDRVAFIRDGRLAAVERMDDVRRSRKRVYVIAFAYATERDRYVVSHPEAQIRGAVSAEMVVAGGADAFVKDLAAFEVADLAAREQTLEELFLHLYGSCSDERPGLRSTASSERGCHE
ncbi:MAG: ABC transporter ATP-binding protein [Gordonibacter sp.]